MKSDKKISGLLFAALLMVNVVTPVFAEQEVKKSAVQASASSKQDETVSVKSTATIYAGKGFTILKQLPSDIKGLVWGVEGGFRDNAKRRIAALLSGIVGAGLMFRMMLKSEEPAIKAAPEVIPARAAEARLAAEREVASCSDSGDSESGSDSENEDLEDDIIGVKPQHAPLVRTGRVQAAREAAYSSNDSGRESDSESEYFALFSAAAKKIQAFARARLVRKKVAAQQVREVEKNNNEQEDARHFCESFPKDVMDEYFEFVVPQDQRELEKGYYNDLSWLEKREVLVSIDNQKANRDRLAEAAQAELAQQAGQSVQAAAAAE